MGFARRFSRPRQTFGPGWCYQPRPKGLWSRFVAGTGTKGPFRSIWFRFRPDFHTSPHFEASAPLSPPSPRPRRRSPGRFARAPPSNARAIVNARAAVQRPRRRQRPRGAPPRRPPRSPPRQPPEIPPPHPAARADRPELLSSSSAALSLLAGRAPELLRRPPGL